MDEKKIKKDEFPEQKEWLASLNTKERLGFMIGGCSYYLETENGKRVITLKAARKYNFEELNQIMCYLIMSDTVDILENKNDIISFRNVMKAIEEKTPPPTPEEAAAAKQSFIDFQKKHPEIFGEVKEASGEKI